MESYYFKHTNHFGEMFNLFEEFYQSNALADVVIAVEGKTINAHRIVLSAGSDYFRTVLTSISHKNHMPVLCIDDIHYEDMEAMLEFMYRGQIVVPREKVEPLRRAAHKLRVKGFENFLRKPFMDNNKAPKVSNQRKMSGGFNRNDNMATSMLNEANNKRHMNQMNQAENKRIRLNRKRIGFNSNPNGTQVAPLRFNRPKEDLRHRIVPNSNSNVDWDQLNHITPEMYMQNQKKYEDMFKQAVASVQKQRAQQQQQQQPKLPQVKLEPDAFVPKDSSLTPVQNDNSSANGDAAINLTRDEHEENQRNENTENSATEKANDLSKKGAKANGQNEQPNQSAGDTSDEEVQGENFTFEMDPNLLTGGWDAGYNDENVPDPNPSCESDAYDEEEDYFESPNFNQEMLFNQANIMNQMNGQSKQKVFYCEHCPKYFCDEDHLQVHIKRLHGVNKLNECNICGKTYAWKSGLYKHKRHVHNITGKTLNQVSDNVMDGQSPSPPTTPLLPPANMPFSMSPITPPPMALMNSPFLSMGPSMAPFMSSMPSPNVSQSMIQAAMPPMPSPMMNMIAEQASGIKA